MAIKSIARKINFIIFIVVTNALPNGDPLNDNRPRMDNEGYGEITDVCIKRKIRNRLQDILNSIGVIFVQTDARSDDGKKSLEARAKASGIDFLTDPGKAVKEACEKWADVRYFGQTFAFDKVSLGITGPVSIRLSSSVDPIEVKSMQLVKSTNGCETEGKSSDRMGMKHLVKFGLYKVEGSINVQPAEKTGFSDDDAELLKECLRTLFVNDASAARPDGSMEVSRLYWFEHNNRDGQYSSAKVHKFVNARLKEGVKRPESIDDYEFIENIPEDLKVEVIEGV